MNDSDVTTDNVRAKVEYGDDRNTYSIYYNIKDESDPPLIGTGDGNPSLLRQEDSPFRGQELSKSVSIGTEADGTLYVDVYSDIESESDADYLTGGFWLFVPDNEDEADSYVFGAFADGSGDPFAGSRLTALTGGAIYQGQAVGAYARETAGTTELGYWDGNVKLEVNFEGIAALGMINGEITDIFTEDEDGSRERAMGRMELESTEIGGALSSGNVKGTVNEFDLTGKWGGEFFGNDLDMGHPGSFAGTLGGTGVNGGGDTVSFAGALGAHIRPSTLVSEVRNADVAATALPAAVGGVTQSSDVTSGINPVSDDTVQVAVSGSDASAPRFVINYDGQKILDTNEATVRSGVEYVFDEPKGTQLFERVSTGIEFYRSVDTDDLETGSVAGDLFVDVYTDYEGSGDMDYLAGGLWIFIPDDATSLDDYEAGVFADGNNPFTQANIARLSHGAYYKGPATGIYTTDDANSFFDATARLVAYFGDDSALGTISGQINAVRVNGEAVAGNPVLMLGSANIGSDDSGFFTGDTRMTFDGSGFTGKWGGQFFGDGYYAYHTADPPTSVAGTFGAANGDGASLLGVFGAYITPDENVLFSDARNTDVAATALPAAAPTVGGVTQSSDVTSGDDPASDDVVEVTLSGSDAGAPRFVINYDGKKILDTHEATDINEDDIGLDIDLGFVFAQPKGTQLFEVFEEGIFSGFIEGAYGEFYRSMEAGDLETGSVAGDLFLEFEVDYEGSGDTDYLAQGLWVFIPDDATSLNDYETGVFVYGNDPFTQANIAGLTGTASYEGSAEGIYTDADGANSTFGGDFTLTADFGTHSELGTIEGDIHTEHGADFSITLESAKIGSDNSGFFTGDTSMTFDGSDFTGKWGGQFFGDSGNAVDPPTSVAGTFGAANGDGASLLGAFGASIRSFASELQDTLSNTLSAATALPAAVPTVGGVTQSSDMTSGVNPVSGDVVQVTVSGSDAGAPRFEINYDGQKILDTDEATAHSGVEYVFDESKGTQLFERVSTGVEFYRSVDTGDLETGSAAGDLFVDVYTDYEGSGDTDYLAGGLWIFIPDDFDLLSPDDYETGVFVDGSDPFTQANIAGLTGTATYEGPATGIYHLEDDDFFDAMATLTADFGDNSALGTISGQIDTVTVGGEAVAGDPVLMLESANIGSGDSGFFTGDTSMTFDGRDFEGKWGGQFFGDGDNADDHPTSVAGTFGAGGRGGLLGVFSAGLQP